MFEGSFSKDDARQLAKEWSGLDQVDFVGIKKGENSYNFEWVDDSFSLLCQLINESTVSLPSTFK